MTNAKAMAFAQAAKKAAEDAGLTVTNVANPFDTDLVIVHVRDAETEAVLRWSFRDIANAHTTAQMAALIGKTLTDARKSIGQERARRAKNG